MMLLLLYFVNHAVSMHDEGAYNVVRRSTKCEGIIREFYGHPVIRHG